MLSRFKRLLFGLSLALPIFTYAVGLGGVQLESSLGEPLRAKIAATDWEQREADCVKAILESVGGNFLDAPQVEISNYRGNALLVLTTKERIVDPAIKLKLDISCNTSLMREYTLLLDPPLTMAGVSTKGFSGSKLVGGDQAAGNSAQATVTALKNSLSKHKIEAASQKNAPKKTRKLLSPTLSIAQIKTRSSSGNRMVEQDVLKLSPTLDGQVEAESATELRLSNTLTIPSATADTQRQQEIKKAQLHFASILRGEDPLLATSKLQDKEKVIDALKLEQNRLQQERQKDKAELLTKKYYLLAIVGLGAALALIIIILIVSALRKKDGGSDPWWAQGGDANDSGATSTGASLSEQEKTSSTLGSASSKSTLNAQNSFNEQGSTQAVTPASQEDTSSSQAIKPVQNFKLGLAASEKRESLPTKDGGSSIEPPVAVVNVASKSRYLSKADALKVEELSDITQEAEFWMTLKNLERAISVLEPHTQLEPPGSPIPWLYLFDLYRETGAESAS